MEAKITKIFSIYLTSPQAVNETRNGVMKFSRFFLLTLHIFKPTFLKLNWFKNMGKCFTVFRYSIRTPYRYFSIVLKVILFLSDRHKIFTVIDYELKFLKMQFLVKSISL